MWVWALENSTPVVMQVQMVNKLMDKRETNFISLYSICNFLKSSTTEANAFYPLQCVLVEGHRRRPTKQMRRGVFVRTFFDFISSRIYGLAEGLTSRV